MAFESLKIPDEADFAIHDRDGNTVDLPTDVPETVLAALRSLIETGEVAIRRMPTELTSTLAAEILGSPDPLL